MDKRTQVEIKPNDFVVSMDRYWVSLRQAVRVTEKCFFYKDDGGRRAGREIRQDRHGVVFAGPENTAKKLTDQLSSSRAQQRQDEERARLQREKRDAEFIANAFALSGGT